MVIKNKIENFNNSDNIYKSNKFNINLFFYDSDNNIYTINTNIIDNSDGYLNLIQKYDNLNNVETLKAQVYFRFHYPIITITDNTGTFILDDNNHSFNIILNTNSKFKINPNIKFTNNLKLHDNSEWSNI
jgi:hypothetical protein